MTIAIIIGVVLVVAYFFLSANGVKLFKKEHKVKAKKSNEEKYEEVLPKEKKEKKEKKPAVKISDIAKKEKLKEDIKKELDAKTSATVKKDGGGTVTKITKEDFLKNNIEVPSTSNLLTEEEKKAMTVKSLPKAKEQPSKPYDFGFSDFDNPSSVKNFAVDDLSQSKDDPFADIDFDAILNGTSSTKIDDPFASLDALDLSDVGAGNSGSKQKYSQKNSGEYFNTSPAFNMSAQNKFGGDPVVVKSLGERFEQVFGSNFETMGGTEMGKEILIGDILSGPRARENRLRRSEREKRKKWM